MRVEGRRSSLHVLRMMNLSYIGLSGEAQIKRPLARNPIQSTSPIAISINVSVCTFEWVTIRKIERPSSTGESLNMTALALRNRLASWPHNFDIATKCRINRYRKIVIDDDASRRKRSLRRLSPCTNRPS